MQEVVDRLDKTEDFRVIAEKYGYSKRQKFLTFTIITFVTEIVTHGIFPKAENNTIIKKNLREMKHMEEKKIIAKIGLLSVSIIVVLAAFTVGAEEFLTLPVFLLLWLGGIIALTAVGNIISVISESISGKDHKYAIQILFSVIITALTVIYAVHEKNANFMGELNKAIILLLFTVPAAANTVRWLVKLHIHIIVSRHCSENSK